MAVCVSFSCSNIWKAARAFKPGHKFCRCACHVTQTDPKHLFTCRHCQFKALLVSYSAKVILTKTLEHTVFQGTMFAVNITNTWNLAELEIVFRCKTGVCSFTLCGLGLFLFFLTSAFRRSTTLSFLMCSAGPQKRGPE